MDMTKGAALTLSFALSLAPFGVAMKTPKIEPCQGFSKKIFQAIKNQISEQRHSLKKFFLKAFTSVQDLRLDLTKNTAALAAASGA